MTKGDKILIIIIITISLVSLGFIKNSATGLNEKYISVQVNGKEIKKIIFDKAVVGKTIPIETEYGYNVLEIGEDNVRIIEADCPDKIDVLQGQISRPGEIIVCLPNKLVVEIIGTDDTEEIQEIDHISN